MHANKVYEGMWLTFFLVPRRTVTVRKQNKLRNTPFSKPMQGQHWTCFICLGSNIADLFELKFPKCWNCDTISIVSVCGSLHRGFIDWWKVQTNGHRQRKYVLQGAVLAKNFVFIISVSVSVLRANFCARNIVHVQWTSVIFNGCQLHVIESREIRVHIWR